MADQESIMAFAATNGLTVKSEFIPWSQSRSASLYSPISPQLSPNTEERAK